MPRGGYTLKLGCSNIKSLAPKEPYHPARKIHFEHVGINLRMRAA